MTPDQEERLVETLEILTAAVASISQTMELTYMKTFPPRKPARDIDVWHQPSDEEKRRADQGASTIPIDDWMKLDAEEEMGPRERQWVEQEEARKQEGGTGEDRPGHARRGPEET